MNEKLMSNNLVVMSNALIEAGYDMTLNEMRLFRVCISMVDTREELDVNQIFELSVAEWNNLFTATANQNAYRDLEKAADRLLRRVAVIPLEDNKTLKANFVSWVEFDPDNYKVKLQFTNKIAPFISALNTHFAKSRLLYTVNFNSKYSLRIYDLCHRWLAGNDSGFKDVDIDFLREKIADGKYAQYGEFKRWVLDVAIKDINEHSDLMVKIQPVKTRKSFTSIQFEINRKSNIAKIEAEREKTRDQKSAQNQMQKAKRIGIEKFEADSNAQKLSMKEFMEIPEGTIFKDAKGNEFVKSASGILHGKAGAIVQIEAIQMIERGDLNGVFS
jgi:plasmid replication initiation protein